jgi:hypothetical protein
MLESLIHVYTILQDLENEHVLLIHKQKKRNLKNMMLNSDQQLLIIHQLKSYLL